MCARARVCVCVCVCRGEGDNVLTYPGISREWKAKGFRVGHGEMDSYFSPYTIPRKGLGVGGLGFRVCFLNS